MPSRIGIQLNVQGLATGSYTIRPYDTWRGDYLEEFEVECAEGEVCNMALPDFTSDMAFKIVRN